MPKLNRELMRGWLEDHNWTVARLTVECNAMGEDTFSEGTGPQRRERHRPHASGPDQGHLQSANQVRERRAVRAIGGGHRRERGEGTSDGQNVTESRKATRERCARAVDLR